jgi:oxygen-dependent protoporphyrinogen oxidase
MSAKLIFGRFFSRTQSQSERRLPKPTIRGTVSAPQGMNELMQKLRARLEYYGVTIRYESAFATLAAEPNKPIIIATPAPAAARILEVIDPVRAVALKKVELLPVITATVSFKDPPPHQTGFGCLFPPVEPRRALGVLMNNFIFPNRASKGFSETWILGGAKPDAENVLEASDQEILNIIIEERHAVLGAGGDSFGFRITRWPQALPHYTLDLEKVLPELQGLRQNVVLIGNYLGQIGLSKILDRAAQLPDEINAKGNWT